MLRRLITVLASLALVAGVFGSGASIVTAGPAFCSGLPSVVFYSENYPQTDPAADEIKFCSGVYPGSTSVLNLSGVSTGSEYCRGFGGINWGDFHDCISSLASSTDGWGSGKTLCLYVDALGSKAGGWSYISSYVGFGNIGSSLNDKLSSVKWSTTGSAGC